MLMRLCDLIDFDLEHGSLFVKVFNLGEASHLKSNYPLILRNPQVIISGRGGTV